MFYFYRIDFSILQPISRIAELLLFILTALVNNFYLTIHYICTWLHFHIIYEGVSKSKVKARRMSGMFWTTRHTLPAPYQVISICSDPWRSTWIVSDLQHTVSITAEDGGSMFLRNVGIYLRVYRRHNPEQKHKSPSTPWEPQMSHRNL
jgi:hypothetical protein